jgi:hypothetical protein
MPAPGDLLLRRYEARYVVGHRNAFAPAAEIEAGDQIGFDGPPDSVGARSLVVIMVCHAAHDAKTDAALFEEVQRLRRTVDESG